MIRSSRIAVATVASFVILLTAATVAEEPGYVITVGGSEIFVANGRMKLTVPGFMQMGFVPEHDSLWMANPRNRTYWQGTLAEYCSESKQAQAAMMAEMMSRLTPQQRAMMEQHTKGSGATQSDSGPAADTAAKPAPKVTVERTDETATIAGRPTRRLRILANGEPFQDLWVSTDSTMAKAINFSKARTLQEEMRECVSGEMQAQQDREFQRLGRMGQWAVDRSGTRRALIKIRAVQATAEHQQAMREGLPLKIVFHALPNAQPMVIDKVENRTFKSTDLVPPADYRRAPLAEVQGAPSMR